MKNLEQAIKNNAKLLDVAVAKKLDSIENRELSQQDIDRITQCIYCDKHLRYNRLFYDIVGKLYEMDTGVTPVKSKIYKKCTHPRWALCSNLDIVTFLKRSLERGYSDIWAMAADVTKVPRFGPREAISILANFDLMQFVLTRYADKISPSELYSFNSFYRSCIEQKESRKYDSCEDCAFYAADCDEIKLITEKIYQWAVENKRIFAPYVIQQKFIVENGKGLVTRFTHDEIDTLVFFYKKYWSIYPLRDFVMSFLEDAGKEWILSLDPNNYDMTSLDDIEARLKYRQSVMTHSIPPGSRWDYEQKELFAWKEKAETTLGRKIML